MTTERVGALRYDVILNTHSLKKGATQARSEFKTFRDGMKANTTAVDRYNAAVKNIASLKDQGKIDQSTALALFKNEKKVLEEQGFVRKRNGQFQKTNVKLLQEELELQKKINREADLQAKISAERKKREKQDYVKRRDRSSKDHAEVMARALQIQMANAKGHRLLMLQMRQRMNFARNLSPGMAAGVAGNIAGALGASGQTIGAVRGAAMLGSRFAVPVAAFGALALSIKAAVTQADRLKRTTIDLTVLLDNNADSAKAMVKQFQAIARRTPLSTAVLADGARQLLSFGRSSQFVVKDLEKLAVIAGGNTERMRLLTKAFADVTAAGKLQGQELRQFTNQGFNPLREMALMTGESYSKLRKQMEEGAFTADMTADTLGYAAERYAGRLERSMNTISAQWEKFKGLMAELAAEGGEGTGLHWLSVQLMKGLNNFTENAKRMADNSVEDLREFGSGEAFHRMKKVAEGIHGDLKYMFDPTQLPFGGRPGKKEQGFFEQTRKAISDMRRKGGVLKSEISSEAIAERFKKSGWTKKRADLQDKYNDMLGEEYAILVKTRRELAGQTELDQLRLEAVRDLSDAREDPEADRAIKQAEDNLKIVEEMQKIRGRVENLKKRRQDEINHEKKLHQDKMKSIRDIGKEKQEQAKKDFEEQRKLVDLAKQAGGPRDDFTAAGADYRFVQQRRNQMEANRIAREADKKREQQDAERNEIMERMERMEEIRHQEFMKKLETVS